MIEVLLAALTLAAWALFTWSVRRWPHVTSFKRLVVHLRANARALNLALGSAGMTSMRAARAMEEFNLQMRALGRSARLADSVLKTRLP